MENALRFHLRSSDDLKVALDAEIAKGHGLASSEPSKRILAVVAHRNDFVGDEEGRCVTLLSVSMVPA